MVSEIGDWIGLLGVAALLYERTGQAVMAAASLAALYLPYLFARGWSAGRRRIPPRTLLIGADVLRAGLILLLLLPHVRLGRCSALVFLGVGADVGLRGDPCRRGPGVRP